MKNIKHLALLGGLGWLTVAGAETPSLRSAKALSTRQEARLFVAEVTEGFHFNKEAPNRLLVDGKEAVKPSLLKERRLEIKLPSTLAAKSVAMLYVCDDALTFCDVHPVALASAARPGTGAAKKVSASSKLKLGKHGFYEGSFEELRKEALHEKKLLLVDFGARWCPGCKRLENEILPTAKFRGLTKDYVKVHIDVDQYENFELGKNYDIASIPTLLVLNPAEGEITRVEDYQPMPRIETFLAEITKDPSSIEKLQTQVKEGHTELAPLLAQRLQASRRFEDAIRVYESLSTPSPELPALRVQAASQRLDREKSDENKRELTKLISAALKTEAKSLRSLGWRARLVGLLSEDKEKKKIVSEARPFIEEIMRDDAALKAATAFESPGEFTGHERFLAAITWAEVLEEAGMPAEEIKAAWKAAAESGKKSGITAAQSGAGLRYLIILTLAEDYEEADRFAQALIAKHPNDKDLLRRRLRVLVALKKFPEAIRVGKESLKHAEGRMEFLVVENLAKAYIGAGQKAEAKSLLSAYLTKEELKIEKLSSERERLQKLNAGLDAPGAR